MGKKKAVSPVVATVLLMMIVVILAIIILLWSRGFIQEAITKEIGSESKTAEQYCLEIAIQPILNTLDGSFGFTNIGNVPVYSYNVKLVDKNTGNSKLARAYEGIVNPQFSSLVKDELGNLYDHANYESVTIIPILLGTSKSGGNTEFECPERNGFTI